MYVSILPEFFLRDNGWRQMELVLGRKTTNRDQKFILFSLIPTFSRLLPEFIFGDFSLP